ncbi:hypothetical protein ACOME3_009823, partial [Neoechinorhynchus agilis]
MSRESKQELISLFNIDPQLAPDSTIFDSISYYKHINWKFIEDPCILSRRQELISLFSIDPQLAPDSTIFDSISYYKHINRKFIEDPCL